MLRFQSGDPKVCRGLILGREVVSSQWLCECLGGDMPTTTRVAAQQAWPCCFCTVSFLFTVKEMTDGLKAGASSESTHRQSCETKLMLRLGQPRPPGDRQRRACRV